MPKIKGLPKEQTMKSFGQEWQDRAWAAYCADSNANTIDKGKAACAGSRWGFDSWEQMPQALRDEYAHQRSAHALAH